MLSIHPWKKITVTKKNAELTVNPEKQIPITSTKEQPVLSIENNLINL